MRPRAVGAAADRRPRHALVDDRDRLPRHAGRRPALADGAPLRERPRDRARRRSRPRTCGRCASWASTLLGRFQGAYGGEARFAPDLLDSADWGDQRYRELPPARLGPRGRARDRAGPTCPSPTSSTARCPRRSIYARRTSARSIFAGGFRPDYGTWVHVPGALRPARLPGARGGREQGRAGPVLRRRPLPPQAEVVALLGRGRGRRDRRGPDRRGARDRLTSFASSSGVVVSKFLRYGDARQRASRPRGQGEPLPRARSSRRASGSSSCCATASARSARSRPSSGSTPAARRSTWPRSGGSGSCSRAARERASTTASTTSASSTCSRPAATSSVAGSPSSGRSWKSSSALDGACSSPGWARSRSARSSPPRARASRPGSSRRLPEPRRRGRRVLGARRAGTRSARRSRASFDLPARRRSAERVLPRRRSA